MSNYEKQTVNIENQKLVNLALFLIVILALGILISLYASRGVRTYTNNNTVATLVSPFENIELKAKSVFVYDIQNQKVIYEKNADEPLPLASITKVMTAVTARGELSNDSVVTIQTENLSEEGDSGLMKDEKWKLKDLLEFIMVSSSNDGASAIAAAAGARISNSGSTTLDKSSFVKKMNEKAKEIGLSDATFYNGTGLDTPDGENGGYASAKDVAKLYEFTLRNYPEVFDATRMKQFSVRSEDNILHTVANTNWDVNNIPNIIGSKTGFTDIAGGNLAILFDAGLGRPIAVVVLGSTAEGRFTDVETLVARTLQEISK